MVAFPGAMATVLGRETMLVRIVPGQGARPSAGSGRFRCDLHCRLTSRLAHVAGSDSTEIVVAGHKRPVVASGLAFAIIFLGIARAHFVDAYILALVGFR